MLLHALAFTVLGATAEIVCPGSYGGHLQGLATDEARNIYWSFTVVIVKTDAEGNLLQKVDAPTHQGGLCVAQGKLCVAVNLGKFNLEPGSADSWLYVYDTETLALLEKRAVPEVVHGAGGVTWHDGAYAIVGGLPPGHNENYVYRYGPDFRFIERRVLQSGYTMMGIQTACYLDGAYWFGIYGAQRALLRSDADFGNVKRIEIDGSYGIAPWIPGQWLRGKGVKADTPGQHCGAALVELLPNHAQTGPGQNPSSVPSSGQ